MSRTKVLSNVLWSTLAVTGCGSDPVHHLADAPPQHDASVDAPAVGPVASYALTVSGTTTCGDAAPATVDLMIQNTGTAALIVSAANVDGGFTVETTLPLTIGVAQTLPLTLRPPVAVIGTDVPATQKTGTLTLTTNAATAGATVAVSATVMGAALTLVDGTGTPMSTFSMSGQSGSCPAPVAVFLKNTGNTPVTVSANGSSDFAYSGFSGGTLAAGSSSAEIDLRVTTVGSCASSGATIVYSVTGALCNGDNSSTAFSIPASYNINGSSSCFCS